MVSNAWDSAKKLQASETLVNYQLKVYKLTALDDLLSFERVL